jgi:TetR/AcrR family transcriptional regulator
MPRTPVLTIQSVELTVRLVNMPGFARSLRAARVGRSRRAATVADVQTTRQRLFAAAASEFAGHGFAGANVDRIARAARVNKAMIYYHFRSKAALYRDILGDMFRAVSVRVHLVADADQPPEDKLRGFIRAIAAEAEARPHFPPIWFREIAEGGTHLDEETLGNIRSIVEVLAGILREGVAAGRFRSVNPLLVHGGIVAPLLLFFASERLRKRIVRAGVRNVAAISSDEVVAHVQQVALAMVETTPLTVGARRTRAKGRV